MVLSVSLGRTPAWALTALAAGLLLAGCSSQQPTSGVAGDQLNRDYVTVCVQEPGDLVLGDIVNIEDIAQRDEKLAALQDEVNLKAEVASSVASQMPDEQAVTVIAEAATRYRETLQKYRDSGGQDGASLEDLTLAEAALFEMCSHVKPPGSP